MRVIDFRYLFFIVFCVDFKPWLIEWSEISTRYALNIGIYTFDFLKNILKYSRYIDLQKFRRIYRYMLISNVRIFTISDYILKNPALWTWVFVTWNLRYKNLLHGDYTQFLTDHLEFSEHVHRQYAIPFTHCSKIQKYRTYIIQFLKISKQLEHRTSINISRYYWSYKLIFQI